MRWRRRLVPLIFVPLACIVLFGRIYYKVWTFQEFTPYILATLIGGIPTAIAYGFKRGHNAPESETLTTPAPIQEQIPILKYGRINVRRTFEKEHGGTYHYSLYLLEISNATPNTVVINCQGFLDLHNNPEIRDHIALWNKNSSDKIPIGHREFLRLFTVSKFYIRNRRVDTKLLFDKKSNIDDSFDYWNVPYTESMNRELRVLLQSENASYPLAAEAFTKTIQYIMDNAIEE